MQQTKIDIRALTLEQLIAIFGTQNEQAFKAKQVYEWLWKKSATQFNQMTNISLNIREWLSATYCINAISIDEMQISKDKTIKCVMKLFDGGVVESVLIPTKTRMTACVSSQVGCSLTCLFCATGKLKRLRNLNADEIYDQVRMIRDLANEKYQRPLTNIVYMGMGEPLLNYTATLESIDKITSPHGLGISPSRITVSTAGVSKMIMKLADDQVKFNLALSLHAANNDKRNHLMPINETNSLEQLAQALNYFYNKTGTRVTLEYVLFKDYNDSYQDAVDLVAFCKKIIAKVNIIEYNKIQDAEFTQTTPERLEEFVNYLEKNHVIVNVRKSRGKDIDAACGQLINKNKIATPVFK